MSGISISGKTPVITDPEPTEIAQEGADQNPDVLAGCNKAHPDRRAQDIPGRGNRDILGESSNSLCAKPLIMAFLSKKRPGLKRMLITVVIGLALVILPWSLLCTSASLKCSIFRQG